MPWDSAVIFAGGKSSRMGKDKALLPFGGNRSLAEYQYRRLLHLFDRVFISTKSNKFSFDANLILDISEESSPMVALVSALESAGDEALFVLSVDMPHIDEAIIASLYNARRQENHTPDIVIAKSPRGLEPLCGIYACSVLPHAKTLLQGGIHRMQTLLDQSNTMVIEFEQVDKFANLNTPEEYHRAKS